MASGLSIQITESAERSNLAAFVSRVLQLDDAAVIRLHRRSAPGILTAWAETGFGVLAARTVRADLEIADVTVAASVLRDGLDALSGAIGSGSGSAADWAVPLGYSMDSAWQGALPPEEGFNHVDDVPATTLQNLAHQGAELATANAGPQGPPRALLDQQVLLVSAPGDPFRNPPVSIPMRVVFALTAMGFVPDPADAAEQVRVRVTPVWLRLDARFGSVTQRRAGGLELSVRPRKP